MHGKGSFMWPDGRRYIGEYSNDKKEGFGEFFWADNSQYSGDFKNNNIHVAKEIN